MAVEIRDGKAAADALSGLRAKWRNPATPTKGEASKAVVEQVAAGILPPESEVTLEQLGYDDVTIQRIIADRRRATSGSRLDALAAAMNPTTQGATDVAATANPVRAGQ
jgi:hypothetical protein